MIVQKSTDLKRMKREKTIKYIFQINVLLVVLSSNHFYLVDETIYFVNILREIPGKDSTDINTVCFMEFVSTGKYLKTTLKRPFFLMVISV